VKSVLASRWAFVYSKSSTGKSIS